MNSDRRGFLKGVGALGAAVAFGGFRRLDAETKPAPPALAWHRRPEQPLRRRRPAHGSTARRALVDAAC